MRHKLTEGRVRNAKVGDTYDTEARRLAVRTLPSGVKTFVAVVDGRRIRIADAEGATEEDIEQARKRCREIVEAGGKRDGNTVNAIVAAYIKGRDAEVSDSAKEGFSTYSAAIKEHGIGARPASEVTKVEVVAFRDWYDRESKGKKGIAANRAVEFLRAAYGYNLSRVEGLRSPFTGWNMNAGAFLDPENIRTKTYDDDGLVALAGAVKGNLRDLVLLCLGTGAREAQVRAWRWQDIKKVVARKPGDDAGHVWNVPAESTKEAVAQLVPLSAFVVAVLEARGWRDIGLVFPGEKPGECWRRPQRSLTKAKLALHDLRRTCSTWMVQNGVAPHTAHACLGHAQDSLSKAYFPKGIPVKLTRAAFDAWGAHLAELLPEAKAATA